MQSSPPFFVIGAPRSGTTYLAELLNQHPSIFITNETRIMLHLNQALNVLPARRRLLLRHKEEWLEHLKTALPDLIESFYRKLGAPEGGRWGDKHPHYADGRTDPECLALIDELFPESQFLHIVRDGRDVIASILAKAWAGTDDEAIDVWIRHVEHARSFGATIGEKRYLEIKYEDLIANAEPVVAKILTLLDLPPHDDVSTFIAAQRRERTPLSRPTLAPSEIGRSGWRDMLSPEVARKIESRCSPLLADLGYAVEAVARDGPHSTREMPPPGSVRERSSEELLRELAEERRRHARTKELLRAERRRQVASRRRHGTLRRYLPGPLERRLASVVRRRRAGRGEERPEG